VTRSKITRAAALLLVTTTACGTVYHPRPGPHIVEVGRRFHRDGKEFEVGPLGGGAEELVAGNAPAVEFARRERSLARRGLLVYGLGLAGIFLSPFAAAAMPEKAKPATFFGVLGLGLGIGAVGAYWHLESYAALRDAINVYNDGIDAELAPSLVPPGGQP
jgi:hypothetical protein